MLILQNGSTIDVTNQNFKSIIKKEIVEPNIEEGKLEMEHECTPVVQTVTSALKQEPEFIIGDFTFEDNINKLINHKVRRNFMKNENVSVEKALNKSNDSIIIDKIELVNECNSIDFIKKDIESEETNENTEELYSEGESYSYESDDSFGKLMNGNGEKGDSSDIILMNNEELHSEGEGHESDDSFGELINASGEEMFNNKKKRNNENKPFECPTCGKTFKMNHNLEKHVLTHSKSNKLINDMDNSFEERINASEEDVNSSDIEEMFGSKRKKNKENRPFDCSTCGKTFKMKHHLKNHVLTHSDSSLQQVRKFECSTCGNKFKKKHHLQRHFLTHSQIKEFSCSLCEKHYKDKYDLLKHMASKHTIKDCSGMVIESYTKFKEHEVIHKKCQSRNSLSIKCFICQKTFLKDKYLKRHLKIHAKITPFVCKICNKSFLNAFFLEEHSRTHTGEKPFQCNKCDKKFSTKSNQIRHSRSHLRVRTCSNCSAEFGEEEDLKAHKKSCILKYKCGECGLVCKKSSNMKRHIKTHLKYSSADTSIDSENNIVGIV